MMSDNGEKQTDGGRYPEGTSDKKQNPHVNNAINGTANLLFWRGAEWGTVTHFVSFVRNCDLTSHTGEGIGWR